MKFAAYLKAIRNYRFSIFRFSIAILIGWLITRISVENLESYFYDLRFRLTPKVTTTGLVQQVIFDTKTVESLQTIPNAKHHLDVVKKILASKPRFLVYNIDPSKIEGTQTEIQELADLLTLSSQVIYAHPETQLKGEASYTLPAPFHRIPVYSSPITSDKNILAKDNVTRRQMLVYQDIKMMSLQLASSYNSELNDLKNIRGSFSLLEALQVNIDFAPAGSFFTMKFEEILFDKQYTFSLLDKIVLLGDNLEKKSDRYRLTPFDRSINAMTTTEIQSNMIDSLIRNNSPRQPSLWLDVILTVLISILTFFVTLNLRPVNGILILSATLAFFTFTCFFAFWTSRYVIMMTHPYLAVFLCYYFLIPYRLIVENRKSWEYIQKNKLLSEVETLKTNFIGMMSHDLKTPLARIQGMTELISKDKNPLTSNQSEALSTIKASTEDLVTFINTILNYAKIESQGIELHKQSKDINSLIKEIILKYDFLAKLKHIQIQLELEPLFSLNIDPDLIKQVLSNLIENAIKYSPENSKILITSEEYNNHVVIQVADQGSGIDPEEIDKIFLKFFRSANAKSSAIKGSGLGLYLAKYFTELHKGKLTCESTLGQGSTFTLEIPIEIPK